MMNKIFRVMDWPIAVKLITAMVIIAVLPLAIVSVINNLNTSTTMREQIGESFAEVATSSMNEISLVLGENVNLLISRAKNEVLEEMLEERNESYEGTEAEILSLITELDEEWRVASDYSPLIRNVVSELDYVNPVSSALKEFIEIFPAHAEMFVTDMYGANVASTGRTSDYYQADEGWWQTAWNDGNGDVYIGDPEYDESAGITAVNMAVPVWSDEGEVIGVLRTTLNIQTIMEVVNEVQIGETGHAKLVDRNGVVIADPHPEHIGEEVPESLMMVSGMMDMETHWHEGVDEEGTEVIVGHAKAHQHAGSIHAIEDLDWTLLTIIESQEALAPVAASTQLSLISGFVALLAAVGLAYLVARGLTVQVRHIMDLFGRIGVGEFDARVEVTSGDELGEMSNSLNAMLDNTLDLIQTREQRDSMQSSVVKLLDEVGGVADGDLTVEAEVTSDITGAIADSFNMMIVQLREIIQDVQEATLEVSSSANEIRATTEHLSQGSEAQAAQITGTSSAIEDMASSIQQVSENAATSAQVGEQALVNAQQGILAVQNTMEGMTRIRDQVQETAKRIKRLGESSQEIGDIVQLIGDIADRTSILALNASIQAAMAGDAGQGFAVVAEEVERLAERSTEATKQIDTLIRTIQNETNEAVAAMESTTNEVVEGSLLAEEAGQALSEIGTVSGRLQELIQSISMASQQQARGSEELAHSMVEIAEVTQQTAVGTKQAAVSINTLATLADELRASVSAFKLPGSNGNVPEEEVIDLSN
jgi:methyl-accepting chemotaxis protein